MALHADTRAAVLAYLERGRAALLGAAAEDPGVLFPSAHRAGGLRPLATFGAHRIRHATATLLVNHGMGLDEVSRYLGHSSTDVTRRYARQTPDALGARAAEALARAGLTGG